MRPYLLDINVLVALSWPSHVLHHEAQAWFATKRGAGFRTCPLTQTGFVRVSSNRGLTQRAATPRAALELLERIVALPGHEFWPDDLALGKAIGREQAIVGHRQVTDAYVVALAASHEGVVATLDRGMLAVVVRYRCRAGADELG